MMRRVVLLVATLLSFNLLVHDRAMARDFETILASGKIRVAIAEEQFVPWLMRDANDDPIGFEIDVTRNMFEGIGIKAEFVKIPFADLIAKLTNGDVDMIVSAMSITPERAGQVLFSNPYGQTDLELVVDASRIPEGAADQSYDMKGMKIAVVAATTLEFEGRSRFPNSEIVAFPNEAEARDAFLNGDVNAIIASKPYPAFLEMRDPERFISPGEPLTSTVEAVAVAPDSWRLLNYVNSWIAQAIASGFLEESTHYWFETLDWADKVPGMSKQIEENAQPLKN